MTNTGRAAVLVEPGRLETWEVPIVDPEPGGLLVRIVVGGACGSDIHIVSGDAGVMPFPIVLGHEGVGRIERLGAGVALDYAGQAVAEGDLVYWSPIALCGRCYSCTVRDEPPCDNSQFFEDASKPNWGTYADYGWLPDKMAFFRLPDGADPIALAALGCALPTAVGGFDRMGGVGLGSTVVVQGAGPVGLASIALAAHTGASSIIAIDAAEERLETARRMGATHTISLTGTSAADRREQVYDLVGGHGPGVVVEAAGHLSAFAEGIDLAGNHGRFLMLGLWGDTGAAEITAGDLTNKNVTVVGRTFHKNRHYYEAMHLAAQLQDRVPLADLVSHRFSIEDAGQALRAIESGEAVKAVIDPSL